ncbi:error-prone DNA polymerase [Rudaea sp.]|uniref:error-prone DNA polymerase n=1 Tax=Rudaea sp. TaxID=2136325 RepID=UPI002ED404AA
MNAVPGYAELHCLSNFSFQRGASTALELFERAKKLGYRALAITDECSLAGIVRAWEASKETGVALIVGSEIRLDDGLKLVLLAPDLAAYQSLCALITQGRRRDAKKGEYMLHRADVAAHSHGLLALWIPDADPLPEDAKWIMRHFPNRAWLTVELHRGPDDAECLRVLLAFAARNALPAVAAGDVHMHVRRRRALQDTLTAIRHRTTLRAGSGHLFANGERHLRKRETLAELYPRELLEETLRIAACCSFDLKRDVKYKYPHEIVPSGYTPTSWLRHLVEQGARSHWPEGEAPKIRKLIEEELALIERKEYEAFFLTVYDVVDFARHRSEPPILCQGRGSAANSVVCFCLGITAVDPVTGHLVFGRFLSDERDEPPDIDVDFEHERREEVIQYVYNKYGRERAALAATVISYRTKSALRDVARVLGFSVDQVDQLSRSISVHDGEETLAARLVEAGFDPEAPTVRRVVALARELHGFPRHLSQHVGGFVICDAPLHTLVPVENAAMAERTIIQWDKDDLDAMGLLKVDCLALGMLTCLRKCFDLIEPLRGRRWELEALPKEDPATYAMIQEADTIGVFQIESRAQMAMLPRLKPKVFYDLVIQVAIVRPGPIQGDMVHPYLQRRKNPELVEYPSQQLKEELKRTLGVPLFQEQVMRIAIVAAGFTPGQADELRRSMAAWKRRGGLDHLRDQLIGGMLERNYPLDFAERIFEQMKGFGDYGFPESHATSFALLAYASSWLKRHEPAAFACALLNSQPMGFYSASQIVQDLSRRGAKVLPVDVRYSNWDCSLEDYGTRRLKETENPQPGLRLGLRQIRGCDEGSARRIEAARAQKAFASVVDLCTRAQLDRRAQSLLAQAGALRGLAGHRHRAHWAVAGVEANLPLFGRASPEEAQVELSLPSTGENVLVDYASTGLTLGPHPVALVRAQLDAQRCYRSSRLRKFKGTRPVRAAGLVIGRQRPQTASGLTFVTLEDEDGPVNVIVRPELAERQRRAFLESRLLAVDGLLESVDKVQHLIAENLLDLSLLLAQLDVRSRDFR